MLFQFKKGSVGSGVIDSGTGTMAYGNSSVTFNRTFSSVPKVLIVLDNATPYALTTATAVTTNGCSAVGFKWNGSMSPSISAYNGTFHWYAFEEPNTSSGGIS